MIAVFINCLAIIVGGLIGCLFSRKISKTLSDIITTAAGVITCVIGFQMAFKYDSIICLTFSLIAGGILGTWWNIDGGIYSLGKIFERLFFRKKISSSNNEQQLEGGKNFAYAFLNSSVLFCVGAMAILGSFKAGIEHDYTIIFTKSVLDGFMAIVFAASLGVGTIFSFLAVLIYQGLLTILSSIVAPYVSDLLLTELSAVGGAMIVMIGINLLGLRSIKTANYLPALILTVIFVILKQCINFS